MKAAKNKYPKEYKMMIELLKGHIKNMPNSPEKSQIEVFLNEDFDDE